MDMLHPTTVSCLEALQELAATQDFRRILDMGCGDGMLSVMAAHWWQKAQVVAADIAEQAVADTQALVVAQGIGARVTALRSDGFSNPAIAQAGPYGLIIFNLLAEPLVTLAPEVKAHVAPGGICVISGILSWLEPGVVQAYEGLGFRLVRRISREPWQTLVWEL